MLLFLRQLVAPIILILVASGLITAQLIAPTQSEITYESLKQSATSTIGIPSPKATILPPAQSTSTVTKNPPAQKKTAAPSASSAPSPITLPSIPTIPQTSLTELNTEVRESLVNILCRTNVDPLKAITATGIIIDSRGVILTNAHVGQYYLLKEYAGPNSVTCIVRTGSPAQPRFHSELLFISPEWVTANKNNLKEERPLGTGENDFALVLITSKIDGSPADQTFAALDVATNDSDIDETSPVDHIVAGYAAGFLGGPTIERDLYVASAVSRIREIFTFGETTVDLVALGSSIVAQKGSSGGAVVSSKDKKLIGLIVTTTDGTTTGERDLRAVTLSHIERSIRQATGKGLKEYLSGNLQDTLSIFTKDTYPFLAGILKSVLTQ